MIPLKQARTAILPALALAAWGVTIWVDLRPAGVDVDRDDLCPAMLAIVFTFWALIAYYYRRSSRERAALRVQELERDAGVMAEGVAAFIRQQGRTG